MPLIIVLPFIVFFLIAGSIQNGKQIDHEIWLAKLQEARARGDHEMIKILHDQVKS